MLFKFTIKLGLSKKSNSELKAYSGHVAGLMNGAVAYSSPVPTLLVLTGLITAFSDALDAYGTTPGNRGSSIQKAALDTARANLENALTTLAYYCENTTPYDRDAFLSGGWDVKSSSNPVGVIGPVRNLVQFKSMETGVSEVQLRWKKPLDVKTGAVKSYNVLRNSTSNFGSATIVGTVTKTRFTDTGLTNPNYFYWVVPIGAAGPGVASDPCLAYVAIDN